MITRYIFAITHPKIFQLFFFFFQAEDGIRDDLVTGVQTCALPIWGGYLIFRLYGHAPPQPVFIFGDAALSGDQLLRDYDHLQSLGSDQAQLLERYQINWVIFHAGDPILPELRIGTTAPGPFDGL